MNIDVTVKIREERVGEFYELVGHWLSGEHPGADQTDAFAATPKNWTSSGDSALARRPCSLS